MKAMAALDRSLDEFTALLDAKDKQEIPIKQQEALGFVGAMEEAMVKGFPYTVPAQYANLPQLKARAPSLPSLFCDRLTPRRACCRAAAGSSLAVPMGCECWGVSQPRAYRQPEVA
jgi:hypothetical protein